MITAATAAAVYVAHANEPVAAAGLIAMVLVLAVLADIDLRTHRLPNRIVGPLALAVVAAVAIAGVATSDPARIGVAVVVGVGFVAAMLAMHIAGGLGMGDVKLSFPIGAVAGWYGLDAVIITILVTATAGGLAAGIVMAKAKTTSTRFSYGPCLALGSVAGMIAGGT